MTELTALKSGTPAQIPSVSHSKSLKEVEFRLKEANSLDGIISYLTSEQGWNVHDAGIVTITSTSVYSDKAAGLNAADLTEDVLNRWMA
jgi:hypothetical protein